MNRSFRAEESLPGPGPGQRQRQPLMGSIRSSDEELSLFLEMRRRENDRNNNRFLQKSDEFDPLGMPFVFLFLPFIHLSFFKNWDHKEKKLNLLFWRCISTSTSQNLFQKSTIIQKSSLKKSYNFPNTTKLP